MVTASHGTTAEELLALERIGDGRFRSLHNLDNGRGRSIFGGQPMAQGLAAARRTLAKAWPAHNLSAQFLRAGDPALPVDYSVDTTRDGRRYASRRVEATQSGKPIFEMLCAFHDPEDGPAHVRGTAPTLPDPETLPSIAGFIAAHAGRLPPKTVEVYGGDFPIELRISDPERVFFHTLGEPVRNYWFRMPSAAQIADPHDQQCLLACMSDYWFAGTGGAMHVRPAEHDRVAVVTLNHSLWFHAPVRADAWLLYATDSPWADHGRGLVHGLVYDRVGTLVASAVQEISIRAA